MSDGYFCPEPGCERTFNTQAGLTRHRTVTHDQTVDPERAEAAAAAVLGIFDEPPPSANGAPLEEPPTLPPTTGETEETRPTAGHAPPKQPRGGLFSGLRKEKPKDGGPDTTETRPRRPAPRRVSTQAFWGDVVEGGASVVAKSGLVPMSRAMVWSSPVAGEIIEEASKGTLIDKGVQPLVRNAEKWSDLFDLIGFWGAIGIAQAQPEKASMALAFARKRLVNLLPKIAANIAKQKKKERAAAEALATVMPELRDDLIEIGIDPDGDPIDGMLNLLFAPPQGAPMGEPAPVA